MLPAKQIARRQENETKGMRKEREWRERLKA
jgi:hypothetical protein